MKRPSRPVVMITSGVVMIAASLGMFTQVRPNQPQEHVPSTALNSAPSPGMGSYGSAPSGATPGLAHRQVCEVTSIPGWKYSSRGIEKIGDELSNTIARYGDRVTDQLPKSWTPEQLAEAARKEIAEDRARLDKQLDEALAGIAAGGIPDWHPPYGRSTLGPCPDDGK